jgi:hypothetical protein
MVAAPSNPEMGECQGMGVGMIEGENMGGVLSDPRTDSPGNILRDAVVFLAGCLGLATILYWLVIDAFFVFDSISILSLVSDREGGLAACWRPMSNGFWRPLPLSLMWLMVTLFGHSPIACNAVPVFFHALNGVLLRCVATRMGWPRWAATAGGVFFVAHFAAFPAVSTMQNIMDVMLGTVALATLCVILHPTGSGLWWRLSGLFLVGLMTKETAVVIPWLAAAWWWAASPHHQNSSDKSGRRTIATLCVLSLLAAIVILKLQSTSRHSYLFQGKLGADPLTIVRQVLDYLLSTVFPFIHIAVMPYKHIEMPHVALWALRFGVAAFLGFLAWRAIMKKDRWPLALAGGALLLVLPPSVASTTPEGRFVYAAIAPVVLLGGELLRRIHGAIPGRMVIMGVLASTAFSVWAFACSPTVREYRRLADEVEAFVAEARRLAPTWKAGCHISIYGHPLPGTEQFRWAYCQQLFLNFVPEAQITVVIDRTTHKTCHAYQFQYRRLVPVDFVK